MKDDGLEVLLGKTEKVIREEAALWRDFFAALPSEIQEQLKESARKAIAKWNVRLGYTPDGKVPQPPVAGLADK